MNGLVSRDGLPPVPFCAAGCGRRRWHTDTGLCAVCDPRRPGRRPRKHETCTLEDCDSPHCARGLCKYHYEKQRRGRVA